MTAIATTDGHSGDADGQQAQMVVGEARKQADFSVYISMAHPSSGIHPRGVDFRR
jgi:hypothetical protein